MPHWHTISGVVIQLKLIYYLVMLWKIVSSPVLDFVAVTIVLLCYLVPVLVLYRRSTGVILV